MKNHIQYVNLTHSYAAFLQFVLALFQDIFRVPNLPDGNNRREHDRDCAEGAGTKNRPELLLEDFFLGQADTNGPIS